MPLWAEGSAYWTLNRLGIEQALKGRLNLSGPRLSSVPTFAAKSQCPIYHPTTCPIAWPITLLSSIFPLISRLPHSGFSDIVFPVLIL
jgi:hypothetical protein